MRMFECTLTLPICVYCMGGVQLIALRLLDPVSNGDLLLIDEFLLKKINIILLRSCVANVYNI